MKLDDRKTRRMMDRMGINMKEIADVEEVIIKTSSKDIHIHGAQVSEVNAQGSRIFQVMGEVEEVERERKKFSEEDILSGSTAGERHEGEGCDSAGGVGRRGRQGDSAADRPECPIAARWINMKYLGDSGNRRVREQRESCTAHGGTRCSATANRPHRQYR